MTDLIFQLTYTFWMDFPHIVVLNRPPCKSIAGIKWLNQIPVDKSVLVIISTRSINLGQNEH